MTFDPLSVAAGVLIGVPATLLTQRCRPLWQSYRLRRRIRQRLDLASVISGPWPAHECWHPSQRQPRGDSA